VPDRDVLNWKLSPPTKRMSIKNVNKKYFSLSRHPEGKIE
jgi:hypothetical protein